MASKMKTLTINDVTYDITDDSAVSFVEEQHLTEAQKAVARANIGAQPVGEYLTEVPEGYAKNEDIKKVDRKVDTLREVVSKFHSNIVCDAEGEVIQLSDASDLELAGLRIFGKTIQNGTPTPEAPVPLESVGADGNVAVTVCGKNLLNLPDGTQTDNGVTAIIKDGVIALNGTANKVTFFNFRNSAFVLEGQTYYYGSDNVTGLNQFLGADEASYNTEPTFTAVINYSKRMSKTSTLTYQLYIRSGATFNNTVVKPYLVLGSSAIGWEAHKAQTLTAQTPNGLPGIPVSSGGNYTDENGQQWICDEIDFARGKYVQRVVKIGVDFFKDVVPTTDSNWYNEESSCSYELKAPQKPLLDNAFTSLCNVLTSYKFAYFYNQGIVEGVMNEQSYLVVNLDKSRGIDTVDKFKAWCNEAGFEVIKFLATPIETDLTAEEIAQYSALHTNYPNTTVYNDAGAGMGVKYVADTKLYIDKKFAELSAALLNQ